MSHLELRQVNVSPSRPRSAPQLPRRLEPPVSPHPTSLVNLKATDAGKIGDIDEIPAGKNELTFTLLLQPGKEDDKLEFINPKIRVYPGMSKNFRIMKPVSDTMDVCDPDYDLCD